MSAPECPREQDVINAIVTGRWPDRCEASLARARGGVRGLRGARRSDDVMRLDHDGLHEEMRLPSAGQVWWRAAIRARLEASQTRGATDLVDLRHVDGLCRGPRDCCRAAPVVADAGRVGKLESEAWAHGSGSEIRSTASDA